MYRALIVEDNEADRVALELILRCMPDVVVEGVSEDCAQALEMVAQLRPDVLLVTATVLEPEHASLCDKLMKLTNLVEIIVMDASDRHAARAFEMDVVDYLVKPLSMERLRKAVSRAQFRARGRIADSRLEEMHRKLADLAPQGRGPLSYDRYIWVRDREGLARITVSKIEYIEASGDYALIHARGSTHILHETITSLENRLDPSELLRIHRGRIVNTKRIRNVRRRDRGLAVVLDSGIQVPVGLTYNDGLLHKLKAHRFRRTLGR